MQPLWGKDTIGPPTRPRSPVPSRKHLGHRPGTRVATLLSGAPEGAVMNLMHHPSAGYRPGRAHRHHWGRDHMGHLPRWLAFLGLLGAGVMYLRSVSGHASSGAA